MARAESNPTAADQASTDSTITHLPRKATAPLERLLNQLDSMFDLAQNAFGVAEAGAFIYQHNEAGAEDVPDPQRQFLVIAAITSSLVQSIQAAQVELEGDALPGGSGGRP